MKLGSIFWLVCLVAPSCVFKPGSFTSTSVPSAPDYSINSNWAALPDKEDLADRVPNGTFSDHQAKAPADVFFLHPTTFTGRSKEWNAQVEGAARLNKKTDETTILYQASIFNGAGRVFAPRYRQAHLGSFFTKDKDAAAQALGLAYEDIRRSFEYYLQHHNQGRPIIIAAHSQGALHAKKLLQTYFDGKDLSKKLVVAYLVGWPVAASDFKNLPPCLTPEQTGCVCSWRTFKHGHIPEGFALGDSIIVTNPLSWKTDGALVPKEQNKGAVLRNFEKVFPGIADAQIHQGILWANKPKFPGSFLFTRKNYHIADLNFYYVDVRENAVLRAAVFGK